MYSDIENYHIGDTMPVLTARGTYSYTIAKPIDGAIDSRLVVLMRTEDPARTSLCNAMEDVVAVVMKREKFVKDDKAVWIETAENEPDVGQVVQRPATMPSWGPEQPVVKILRDLQTPEVPAIASEPSLG